jgi:hypothetical protein
MKRMGKREPIRIRARIGLLGFVLLAGGCNERSIPPGNDDLSSIGDLSGAPVPPCAGPPRFFPATVLDGGRRSGDQFCPTVVLPCSTEKLDLLGDNFACADVQVEIEGFQARILSYTPTYCLIPIEEDRGITVTMPDIPALQNLDGGTTAPLVKTRIHVSNPQGSVDSDLELRIQTSVGCG